MDKDEKVYLQHILESITYIEKYIQNLTREGFERSVEKQDSIIRRIGIIGEAVKSMSDEFKNKHGHIPWKKIAGMRDKLIHQYFGVEIELVWDTVQNDSPQLKKDIAELLK